MTNNMAEAYSLWIGTKILQKKEIKDPIVIGDSAIIIATMEAEKEFKSVALNKIIQRIISNTKNMGKIIYNHVLRTQNKDADLLANKAVDKQARFVRENDKIYEENIP